MAGTFSQASRTRGVHRVKCETLTGLREFLNHIITVDLRVPIQVHKSRTRFLPTQKGAATGDRANLNATSLGTSSNLHRSRRTQWAQRPKCVLRLPGSLKT
jgi:hypothetical protein